MTDQARDDEFDRLLHSYLAWQAEDLVVPPTATEVARRIGSRTGIGGRRARVAPQLVWVALLGLLVAGAAGAAVVGARLLQREPVRAYEAVFLRFDETSEPPVLRVVAVDALGRERTLAERPVALTQLSGPPTGVVSPSGLLAIPSRGDRYAPFHWEIVDLHRRDAPAVVVPEIEQDIEQLGYVPWEMPESRPAPFWGPGDRLVIPWRSRADALAGNPFLWTFVDGRTGTSATAPTRVAPDMRVLPHWAADGSGVVVYPDPQSALAVLRPDGTLADGPVAISPSTFSRRHRTDGRRLTDSREGTTDVAWTATGDGMWRLRRAAGDRALTIERELTDATQVVAEILDPETDAAGGRLAARFMGLAPDDSLLVIGVDRVVESGDTTWRDAVIAVLVHPDTGATFAIDGTFAGWLETTALPSSPSPSTSPTASSAPVAQPPSTRAHDAHGRMSMRAIGSLSQRTALPAGGSPRSHSAAARLRHRPG